MLKTLLNDKTTVLMCIIGVICLTVLAALKVVDGPEALKYIIAALGIGGTRQVVSDIQKANPPTPAPK